jgi:FG-GAP repeat
MRLLALLIAPLAVFAGQADYQIHGGREGFAAANAAQELTVRFHDGQTDFVHAQGRFSLALAGEAALTHAEARGNRVEFTRGAVTEWFVNREDGLEQGFTVASKRGTGVLEVKLDVGGDFLPVLEHGQIALRRGGVTVLEYGGLQCWDASGKRLASHAEVEGRRIRLVVDDSAARYPVTVDPIVTEAILSLPEVPAGYAFGTSVAVSGDTAVVGSFEDAYVMVRSGGVWTKQASLTQADGSRFASSTVAIDGDTIAVGAPFVGFGGTVLVFTRTAGVWTLQAQLMETNPTGGDGLGSAIALKGDTLVAGAPFAGQAKGAAYVFTRSGGVWTTQAMLQAPVPAQWTEFGISVSLSGNTAAISAADFIDNVLSAVFVFVQSGSVWSTQATLTNPDSFPTSGNSAFGTSVAIDGDTVLVGAPGCLVNSCSTFQGVIYVFVRTGVTWSEHAKLKPSDTGVGDFAGDRVALSGDVALVSAAAKNGYAGAVYIFSRSGVTWTEFKLTPATPPVAGDTYGSSLAINNGTLFVGAENANSNGLVYAFRFTNVAINSNPAGQTFTLTGAGCGANGTFTTPYTGLWTGCTVQWNSPANITGDTRTAFQSWSDNGTQNPRTFLLSAYAGLPLVTFMGNFETDYLLTTQSVPVSGGMVTGAGWYAANSSASVGAAPNSGFVFTGFNGGLSGSGTPQALLMNGPKTVTGGFSTTPPAVMTGVVAAKSGASSARVWTMNLTNAGPGTAYGAQVFVLSFTQTFGVACTSAPVRVMPASYPVPLGNLAVGGGTSTMATIDFSACPVNARFTVNLGYMSNGGASGGLITLVNQTQ